MGFIIPVLMLVAFAVVRRMMSNRAAPRPSPSELGERVQDAELLGLEGQWQKCLGRLEDLEPLAAPVRGDAGHLVRGTCHLLHAEFALSQGDAGNAHGRFRAASEACGQIGQRDQARDLELKVQAGQCALAVRFALNPDVPNTAALLLSRESEADHPTVWLRFARLSHMLAQVHHERGNWPLALRGFEAAVRIGERVPAPPREEIPAPLERPHRLHVLGRAIASTAAQQLGSTLCTSGELDIGLAWLDRSVTTLGDFTNPLARNLRAIALLQRATDEPDDPLAGSPQRRRALERAIEEGKASGWSSGLGTASRAAMLLARHHTDRGEFDAAIGRYEQALDCLEDATGPGACELATSALLGHGLLLRDLNRAEEAIDRLRAADARGRSDPDPDARSLATVSACHAHNLLLAAGRGAEARTLLDGLEARIPALRPEARIHAAVMVGRERAAQQFSEGHPDEAMETLAAVEARASGIPHPDLREVARNVAADRGRIALSQEAPDLAIDHFARALDMGGGGNSLAADDLFRSDVTLEMARSMAQVGRIGEARVALQRAFEFGRDSGRGSGRAGAAVAALNLGLSEDESWDRRREWLEAAVRFGQLSGVPRGLEVAKTAQEHLRELGG